MDLKNLKVIKIDRYMLYSNFSQTVKSIYDTEKELILISFVSHAPHEISKEWHKPFDIVSTQIQNQVIQIEYSSNDLSLVRSKFDELILEGPVYPQLQEFSGKA